MLYRSTLLPALLLSCMLFCIACGQQEKSEPAEQMMTKSLNVGGTAAPFQGTDQNGQPWQLDKDFTKDYLVVYFYPAAMTGGCTAQACGFRDSKSELDKYNVDVVGISGDEVDGLKYFQKANGLNFTLLSDNDGSIAKQFSVPIGGGSTMEREIDGKKVSWKRDVTASRWTFVLDKSHKVVLKNTEVDAANDSKAVLAFLEKVQKKM